MFTFLVFLAVVCGFFFYLISCFTIVTEGTSKQVVRFGEYRKTLFVKKGYKLDENCELIPDVSYKTFWQKLLGGACWVSWLKPLGIDKIYNQIENFPDKNLNGTKINFILTGTQFQHGLEFIKMEDSNMLPLSGKITMTVMVTNPYKAVFLIKNWFDALVLRILPFVRQYISEHTYDQIINNHGVQLDADVLKMLNQAGPNGELSIISTLKEQYGINLIALETVNVDPPEGYRETTLAKYQAQQTAERDTQETAGRILKSVAITSGLTVEELQIKLKKNPELKGILNNKGGFKEDFDFAKDQLKRDRATASGNLSDIRVGNTDGTSFQEGAIIGSIAAAFSQFSGGEKNPSKNPNDKKVGEKKKPRDMTSDELEAEWERDQNE